MIYQGQMLIRTEVGLEFMINRFKLAVIYGVWKPLGNKTVHMKSLAFGRNRIVIQLWLYGQSGGKGVLKTGEVGKKRKIARQ